MKPAQSGNARTLPAACPRSPKAITVGDFVAAVYGPATPRLARPSTDTYIIVPGLKVRAATDPCAGPWGLLWILGRPPLLSRVCLHPGLRRDDGRAVR